MRNHEPAMYVPGFDDSPCEPPRDPRDSDQLFRVGLFILAFLVAAIAIASCGRGA